MNITQSSKLLPEYHLENEMIGLYHNVEALLGDTTEPVIQFVSSHKNEGVTTISREFASVAANIFGRSVLVLEAGGKQVNKTTSKANNSKKNQEHEKIKHNEIKPPLNTSKKSNEDVNSTVTGNTLNYIKDLVKSESPYQLQSESLGGLHIGSLSKMGASASILFTEKYFERMITLIRKKYDLVVIDTPPACESSIGLAIASKADGVILVVAAESTRWPIVARVKSQIEKAGGNLLGTILNKQKHHIPDYIYKHLI